MHYYLLMSVLLSIVSCSLGGSGPNLGHRLSGGEGEHFDEYPENSLITLKLSLTEDTLGLPLQYSEDYRYMEFDVHETFDQKIIVLHDINLIRVCRYEDNKEIYDQLVKDPRILQRMNKAVLTPEEISVRYLDLEDIKKFKLSGLGDQSIPTLDEVFDEIKKHQLVKPIAVEIKRLYSDAIRFELVDKVNKFVDDYLSKQNLIYENKYDFTFKGIGFIATEKNFEASFPGESRAYFCEYVRGSGLLDVFGIGDDHASGHCF